MFLPIIVANTVLMHIHLFESLQSQAQKNTDIYVLTFIYLSSIAKTVFKLVNEHKKQDKDTSKIKWNLNVK